MTKPCQRKCKLLVTWAMAPSTLHMFTMNSRLRRTEFRFRPIVGQKYVDYPRGVLESGVASRFVAIPQKIMLNKAKLHYASYDILLSIITIGF